MSRSPKAAAFCFSIAALLAIAADDPGDAAVVDVRKIWDRAPHNAFTDLLRHEDRWYCVFREGRAHVSPDGALRVLTSEDGETWTSAARITAPDADLRDAKITVAPDGRLMLCGAGAMHPPADAKHRSYVWYSDDGRDWGDAIAVGEPNFWLWRVTWHEGTAYAVGYATDGAKPVRLYRSADGRTFDVLVPELADVKDGNEASLLFGKDDTCHCLLRRDAKGESGAMLGTAMPPYTDWTWRNLGERIGGPQLVAAPDGGIVVGGRSHAGGPRTRLWRLDPAAGTLDEIATLPSGGDTSYPGLVFHDGLLWVSYYSSHEGETSIYLARVRLPGTAADQPDEPEPPAGPSR